MRTLSIGSDRNLFDPKSAVAQRIIGYAERAERYTVVVFTLRSRDGERDPISLAPNVRIYPTNSRSKFSYISDAVRIGFRTIREGGEWNITCQDPFEAGLVGWRIASRMRTPLHLQIHTDFMSPYFRRESFLNRVRVILAKFLLPRANSVRVVSERVKHSIRDMTRASVTVSPILVDVPAILNTAPSFDLHRKHPHFSHIVLMVSRLTKEKDIPTALKAFQKVHARYPKAGLLIVGDGPERKSLRSKVESLKLDDAVVFEGWQDDIVSYYKGADVFLNTSRYEGYGMSLIEAAAAGCAIVTTDVGVVGEVLKDNESTLVYPVDDAEGIARGVEKILSAESLKEKLGSRAQKEVLTNISDKCTIHPEKPRDAA